MSKIGDVIKERYEDRTRYYLPRRTYTIIRVDGKNFSSYTKKMNKPFDNGMISDMITATIDLCKEVAGTVFAYVQSDEISLLVTDFNNETTEAWFNGNLQKIVTVAAATATASFNDARISRLWRDTNKELTLEEVLNSARFDGRAFTMPSKKEVKDYFVYRYRDCIRNSISMAARAEFSHKSLMKKNSKEMIQMLSEQGKPWDENSGEAKYGSLVYQKESEKDITFTKKTGEVITIEGIKRKIWTAEPVTSDFYKLLDEVIPNRE